MARSLVPNPKSEIRNPQSEVLVWFNGRLVPERRATIGVWEPGCAHGEGVFETLRVYSGVPFRFGEHLRRLRSGARSLGWSPLPPDSWFVEAARRTIAANRCRNGVLRIIALAAAGCGSRTTCRSALAAAGCGSPLTGVPKDDIRRGHRTTAARPVISVRATPRLPYPSSLVELGAAAVTIGRQPSLGGAFPAPVKVTSYVAYRAAMWQAQRRGADEGLFVDRYGRYTEGTRSSLFVVSRRGQIVTPPLAAGILAGVTRHVVSDLARRLRLPLAERPISPQQLFAAREAFLTSSLLEVAPLVRVDGHRIGSGRPGLTARLLRAAYRRLVIAECR